MASYFISNEQKDANSLKDSLEVANSLLEHGDKIRQEARAEQEKGFQAKLNRFSDEKGQELNAIYEAYLTNSIAENFETVINLTRQKVALMEEVTAARMEIAKEKNDAQLELQAIRYEIEQLKAKNFKIWAWRIGNPLLGILFGIIAFLILGGGR